MATARRLYLYLIAGLGLMLMLSGLTTLVRLFLEAAGVSGSSSSVVSMLTSQTDPDKADLALALAMVGVGLPLWLFHWLWARRLATGDGEAAGAERRSIVRSFYFACILISLLVAAVSGLEGFLRDALDRQFNVQALQLTSAGQSAGLAAALVYGAAWIYHARARFLDVHREAALRGAAAWVSRLYLYGAAFIGLWVAVSSITSLIGNVVDAVGRPELNDSAGDWMLVMSGGRSYADWWVGPVIAAVVSLLIWGLVWATHLRFSNQLLREPFADLAERASRVRLSYFVGAVVLAAFVIAGALATGLGSAIAWAVKAADPSSTPAWRQVVVAVLACLVPALLWIRHRDRAQQEAAENPASAPVPFRVADYSAALVGLTSLGVGLSVVVALILEHLTGAGGPAINLGTALSTYGLPSSVSLLPGTRSWQVAQALAVGLVGAAIWLWLWIQRNRIRQADPAAEAQSTARWYYLYAIGAGTIIPAAAAAALCVHSVARVAVGFSGSNLARELSDPTGLLVVMGLLFAYHLWVLLRDRATGLSAGAPAGGGTEPVAAPPAK
jgi:hypothetical protein